MKYTIDGQYGDEVEVNRSGDNVYVTVIPTGTEPDVAGCVALTVEQFKEFRRAIGYVWTEIEAREAEKVTVNK